MIQAKSNLTGFVLALLVVGVAWAGDLPRARPEEVGFSAARLAYIDQVYADKVNQGEIAGIVTLIARFGEIAHFSAVGYADVEKKQKMETDTIFRLYSMTKPITSTALMILYEGGRFQMTDPLAKYIPEFANLQVLRSPDAVLTDTIPMKRAPTIKDAFRHTTGFAEDGFSEVYREANIVGPDVSLAEMMSRLSKIPLRYQPGTEFVYGFSPDIQARLVEVLSGMDFDEFLEDRLFSPLGMKDTIFWVRREKANRLASVYTVRDGKLKSLGGPDS